MNQLCPHKRADNLVDIGRRTEQSIYCNECKRKWRWSWDTMQWIAIPVRGLDKNYPHIRMRTTQEQKFLASCGAALDGYKELGPWVIALINKRVTELKKEHGEDAFSLNTPKRNG